VRRRRRGRRRRRRKKEVKSKYLFSGVSTSTRLSLLLVHTKSVISPNYRYE